MDRLRQHLSRRRRSSSSRAPLQSPRPPNFPSTSTDWRKDERDVSPRRLYVTSDTHDFDPSIIARFQGEGFEVEYLPFPGGNEDDERDRKDLENLLHEREDDLEPGERYAVVGMKDSILMSRIERIVDKKSISPAGVSAPRIAPPVHNSYQSSSQNVRSSHLLPA